MDPIYFFFFLMKNSLNFIQQRGQRVHRQYIIQKLVSNSWGSPPPILHYLTLSRIGLASLAITCAAVLLLLLVCEIFQLSNFLSHHEIPSDTFWIEIAGVTTPLKASVTASESPYTTTFFRPRSYANKTPSSTAFTSASIAPNGRYIFFSQKCHPCFKRYIVSQSIMMSLENIKTITIFIKHINYPR